MPEIIARIGPHDDVELTTEGSVTIDSMTPEDAAYLARGLLSCAAALSVPNKPPHKAIIGDAQFPILEWKTMTSTLSGKPVVILSIPPGIELTFELTLGGARELGSALVHAAEALQPLVPHSGAVIH
jgi:hypothetical protein